MLGLNRTMKIEEGELKTAFAAMGKEELMKFANNPFWVRMRWFLFILFWLVWLGMLLGAITIIYSAPKCNPPPPREWWEEGPLVEIKPDVKSDQLKFLKDNEVKGLIIEWPEDSYSEINDDNNVIKLLKVAKEIDIPIALDLEASMSNIWFEKSESRTGFEDYYIWRASDNVNASGSPEPPNNWISRKNESSWKYSTVRKEFYYAPEGWPQLNFRNKNVTEEFSKVLKTFIDKGAKGFRIRDAHILLVDANFENQTPDNSKEVKEKGYFLTDYGFYVHSKTESLDELGPVLKNWRNIVKNLTNNGVFMVKNILDKMEAYKVDGSFVVDLPAQSNVFNKPLFEAEKVVHSLEHIFKTQRIDWPLWTHKSAALPSDVYDSITYLLPGVPLLEGGEAVDKQLAQIRKTPSIMHGNFEYKAIANKTVLSFSRQAPGSPGVLVAVNPSNDTVKVNFLQDMNNISEEVTIRFTSKNFNETNYEIGSKKDANNIFISPRASLVLFYTYQKNEE
ncbi:hypothetical protein WA026_018677 [Henosepilachna vigintioctopunctata]|uniref:alpha-glucosidase n=1 Tax=Henosepilachna vigintioctopunctata TaxID=420089 RepID=A0AAW1U918_9CUCU